MILPVVATRTRLLSWGTGQLLAGIGEKDNFFFVKTTYTNIIDDE